MSYTVLPEGVPHLPYLQWLAMSREERLAHIDKHIDINQKAFYLTPEIAKEKLGLEIPHAMRFTNMPEGISEGNREKLKNLVQARLALTLAGEKEHEACIVYSKEGTEKATTAWNRAWAQQYLANVKVRRLEAQWQIYGSLTFISANREHLELFTAAEREFLNEEESQALMDYREKDILKELALEKAEQKKN